MFNLEWLLSPVSVEKFRDEIWQRRSTIIASHRPHYFDQLFSFQELELVLEYSQPKPPRIRLASSANGQVEEPIGPDGRLDIDRIRRYFAEGYTIIVNGVEDFAPRVASLIQAMQECMSFRVEANAYLTPPAAQGFKPHYDTHDVIVAHIAGEKLWRVYGPETACPLTELTNGDPFRRERLPAQEQLRLRPGDVLYIPRGWIHEAESVGGSALHITLGIHVTAGRDLVQAAVDALCRVHAEFRQPLPMGFLRRPVDVGGLSELLVRLTDLMRADGSAEEAIGAIEDGLIRRGRTGGDGQLVASVDELKHLTLDTRLDRRRHLHARLVATESGVGLQFSQSLLQGPPNYRAAMEFVLGTDRPFLIKDLPGLDAERQIAFAQSLLRDGLVRLSTDEIKRFAQLSSGDATMSPLP
jgi:hypothetical protein